MIRVSFYLLTPNATSQSQVYVSISNKEKRLRFATGQSFITKYCNARKKKGTKELVKRGSPFYFEYSSKLNEIRDSLLRIEMNLSNNSSLELEEIRDSFYLQTGKIRSELPLAFYDVYRRFVVSTEGLWSEGTRKHFTTLQNHLQSFEESFGEITMQNLNESLWIQLRDKYFVEKKKFGNSTTNANLKKFKQFIIFAHKKKYITSDIDLDELKYLEEIEPFKIALSESEVEILLNLDLSESHRLDKIRDLFILEILTGQRFSDIPKLLDPKNISTTNIQIYQQKTDERVTIPLHPKLKKHLAKIFKKYPQGLPLITNQKFNSYLKEICVLAKFTKEHSWSTKSGKKQISQSDYRYNLITSHTGRRTFCTLALKQGIPSELIMKVTGHKKYEQFREYVKVDDQDLENVFDGILDGKITKSKRK